MTNILAGKLSPSDHICRRR